MSVITGFYTFGTTIGQVLQDWETMGIFEYVLPALLIFAVIFGILMKSKILGDSRGILFVISIAAALLGMQSVELRAFFRTIFPYAGIAIAILLVGLILTGLFGSDKPWWNKTFFGIGMAIAAIVVMSSLSSYNWSGSWWWQDNWQVIIVFAAIIGLVLMVILPKNKPAGV
jgi:hypothetical protein